MKTQASQEQVQSSQMLNSRLSANKRATRDFDEWCFRQFPEIPLPATILDLGCGNGKQLHLFSRIFDKKSSFWGIDLSSESLSALKDSYQSPPELRLIEGSFDKMDEESSLQEMKGQFDLLYAAYALYYTEDLPKLIQDAFDLLKPGGILWVIGPDRGTNDEFLRIIRPLHEVEPFMDYVFDEFMPAVVQYGQETGFRSVHPAMLHNKVIFPTSDSFLNYLRNSLFYREGHDEKIESEVKKVIENEGTLR